MNLSIISTVLSGDPVSQIETTSRICLADSKQRSIIRDSFLTIMHKQIIGAIIYLCGLIYMFKLPRCLVPCKRVIKLKGNKDTIIPLGGNVFIQQIDNVVTNCEVKFCLNDKIINEGKSEMIND